MNPMVYPAVTQFETRSQELARELVRQEQVAEAKRSRSRAQEHRRTIRRWVLALR